MKFVSFIMRKKKLALISLVISGASLLIIYSQKRNNNELSLQDKIKKRIKESKQIEYVDKKGMRVIVGKYVGESLDSLEPTLSWDEINANNYNPINDAGENGEPYFLSKSREERLAKRLWHINKFNIFVSDRIPLNRSLPDMRKPACRKKKYPMQSLSEASIIIVFHNEAYSTLLRTVVSVINRSPKNLISEIILVDDASNKTFLGHPLEAKMKSLEVNYRVIRTQKRVGLIKARLEGAKMAVGSTLLFLDAHCEVTKGWLEPLLHRISEDRSRIVCPVIDIINDDNFGYIKSFTLHWGAFNWELHFRWYTMSREVLDQFKKDPTAPYKTPVMAGGLFAVDRQYFYKVGAYDSDMDIWGGENLEMSFRVWMCEGSVEISPCSHVGHVFRRASPYSFPREGGVGRVLNSNLARVAHVWMDDYAKFYFKVNPTAKTYDVDTTKRSSLRKDLKCKNFDWFLNNIWPQHFFPTEKRFFGRVKHFKSGRCIKKPLAHPTKSQISGPALIEQCTGGFSVPELMVMTKEEDGSAFVMTDESVCLDAPTAENEDNDADIEHSVRFQACNELSRQKWTYDLINKSFTHHNTRKCLSHLEEGTSDTLVLRACRGETSQEWVLEKEQAFV